MNSPEKNLDTLQPINHGIVAEVHTPIYKIHRYFARRPYNVFRYLVEHYSNPDSIILDPFCGGGVTIVEGLRLKRKVIGVDLNPIATYITKAETLDIDLGNLTDKFNKIKKEISNEIKGYYSTKCPKCGKTTFSQWIKWSWVVRCPHCEGKVVIAQCQKESAGKFKCYNCEKSFEPINTEKLSEQIISLKVNCQSCNFNGEKDADSSDIETYHKYEVEFEEIISKKS